MKNYQLAVPRYSGEFEIVEDFEARNDTYANRYAERTCKNDPRLRDDWYVLDASGNNING